MICFFPTKQFLICFFPHEATYNFHFPHEVVCIFRSSNCIFRSEASNLRVWVTWIKSNHCMMLFAYKRIFNFLFPHADIHGCIMIASWLLHHDFWSRVEISNGSLEFESWSNSSRCCMSWRFWFEFPIQSCRLIEADEVHLHIGCDLNETRLLAEFAWH